jgi:hypothetical protein
MQHRLNKEAKNKVSEDTITYVEDYKLPEDNIARTNNRLLQIIAETKRLRESLEYNENKIRDLIRDLIKKEFEKGNKIIVNDMRVELTTDPDMLFCYDDENILIVVAYKNINSVVIKK